MLNRHGTSSRREFLQAGAVAMTGAEFSLGRASASGMFQSGRSSSPVAAMAGRCSRTHMLVISEMLPFERGAMMNCFFNRVDREVYQSAADILDLMPAEVMMVAAHSGDLRAAKDAGLRTAFVARPLEYGPNGKPDLKADSAVDISARDFNDLASQMGA